MKKYGHSCQKSDALASTKKIKSPKTDFVRKVDVKQYKRCVSYALFKRNIEILFAQRIPLRYYLSDHSGQNVLKW